jgi:dimethylglycine dehydrogenase
MRSHARVVVIGGGIMGVGLLYHLALEGWRDLVLLEKGELSSGSTWHAAGQCPHFNGSLTMTRVHVYGTRLYPRLAALTGQPVSWRRSGGLRLATTADEVDWFRQVLGFARLAGYEAHIIGPEEIRQHHPFLEPFGVRAAYLTVDDGHVSPADVTAAMAAGARRLGAEVHTRTRVTGVERLPGGEWRVATERGGITCEHVVNAAGSYAAVVGGWTGHHVPLANMLHHYVVTEPLPELAALARELPVVRDPYSHCYLREETDGILVGPYETAHARVCWDGQPPPWSFEGALLPPELDRLTPWLARAAERLPLFGRAGLRRVVAGAITHTPDGVYLSGPAPGPPNYWLHCGASIGICQAGGASRYLAQWMVHGQAEVSMRECDPRRFGPWATDAYTAAVATADYEHMYHCFRPAEQHAVGRDLRTSAVHARLAARGAQFGQVFGWERARWYDPTGRGERFGFRRSNWWEPVREECRAVRERAGLMDLSAFAKFEVTGRDAAAFLDRVCANRLPARDGGLVLAHLLNAGGFLESELTVTRLAGDRFYLVAATAAQVHDLDQLRRRLRPGEAVTLVDVTDARGCLVLAGPRARDVLGACTDADLGNAAFPWLTGCELAVAGVAGVRALRVSYVGELGWELHVPVADVGRVFDALLAAGRPHGLGLFGTYAMQSLRLEKAYRAWGAELTSEVDMFEASMERFLCLDKPDFVGKAASLARRAAGPRTRLAYLAVDAADADCLGNEPVWHGDRVVGVTTSGAFGHAVGRSLAFAYVEPALADPGQALEVLVLGERRPAEVLSRPAWDPDNTRPRA